jgi:hypothetical protein
MPNKIPVKIGLLTNSNLVSKYVFDLAQWAINQDNIQINLLIIQKNEKSSRGFFNKNINLIKFMHLIIFMQQIAYSLIVKFETILLKKIFPHNNHFKKYNLYKLISSPIFITPDVSNNNGLIEFNNNDRKKIRDLNLELIVQCDFEKNIKNILNIPRSGVVKFNYGDNKYPPGFWEVYYKKNSTSFKIERLTEENDDEIIIFEGKFQTQFYYSLNQAFLYTKSNHYMKEVLSKISLNKLLPEVRYSAIDNNFFVNKPNFSNYCYYLTNIFIRLLKKVYRKYVQKKRARWGVAFSNQNWESVNYCESIKIKNPIGCFLADPFLFNKSTKDYCFVEEFNYKDDKAHISVYELNNKTYSRLGVAINEPFHLSFPYIFEYQDTVYMCPETSQNKDIRLYESTNFPMQWRLSKVLMSNVDAADTMIFKSNDMWWLFTNMDLSNISDHASELSIFYSETGPITDNWIAHQQNPVIINSNKARNAGFLIKENILYRVSQTQGFDLYGESFSVNRVSQLDKYYYKEDKYFSVKPDFFMNIVGTHHCHSNENYTVFDYLEISKINY